MEALFDISLAELIIIGLLVVIVVQLRSIGDSGTNEPPSDSNLGGG